MNFSYVAYCSEKEIGQRLAEPWYKMTVRPSQLQEGTDNART